MTWAFPGLFVILWSTGFIGAKLGLPYADPLIFLELRFLFVLAILLPGTCAAIADCRLVEVRWCGRVS